MNPASMKSTTSEEYYGTFTELLAPLVDKYSQTTMRGYMRDCSALLIQIQEGNALFVEPVAGGSTQEAAFAKVVAASGEYYAYLSKLPEDVRRFLILMGGVTMEDLECMRRAVPSVSRELDMLALVAPTIQAVRPKNYVMPIDPITSKLAQLKEFNEVTVARKKNLSIQTAVTIDCPAHMKIDGNFQLTNYDKSIINGVVSILECGNSSFTVPMLYHAMTGKENPTVDDVLLDDIKAKLDTMRKLSIKIDLTEEIKAHMIEKNMAEPESVDAFSIEGYLLPLNKFTGIVNGKQSEMYQIIDIPPLHSYAKLKKQITTVSIDLLRAPLNNTATTIPLKTYLLGRIEAMKNDNNKMTRDKILFVSVYRELGESDADKKRKKRIRDYTGVILTHFINMGYITQYQILKEGRTITGVRIWWTGKMEK